MNPINRLSRNYAALVFTSGCMFFFFIVWIILNELVTRPRFSHFNYIKWAQEFEYNSA